VKEIAAAEQEKILIEERKEAAQDFFDVFAHNKGINI